MLLRRVSGSGEVAIGHELLAPAGRARAAIGGGARGAKRLSAGVPAVSCEGGGSLARRSRALDPIEPNAAVRQDVGMLNVAEARGLAAEHLAREGSRWSHVQAVGGLAESLLADGLVDESVVVAAWLHDVGYAPAIRVSGLHSLDGAWFLRSLGVSDAVVGLVGRHTGAEFEAEERGLLADFSGLPLVDVDDLEVLTLVDLVCGPAGDFVTPEERLAEIGARYAAEDPVHQAVSRSSVELLASAARVRARLGLPDEWPLVAAEGVFEAQSH